MKHLPQPDFLRPVARPGWLAWAWCGTGLLVLGLSAADGLGAWQARQQALDRLDRASRLAQAPRLAAPNTSASTGRSPALARAAEARRWLDQLAQPWPAVWAASEAAPDGLRWLQLDHGPAGLRLTGLATSTAPAEAAAEALRSQQQAGAPLWQAVALSSVERMADGQRFELVARLVARFEDGQASAPAPGAAPP